MLTSCDKEPIHIIGKIQSHAYLLAIEPRSGKVSFISENLVDLLKLTLNEITKAEGWELLASLTGFDSNFNQQKLMEISETSFAKLPVKNILLEGKPFTVNAHWFEGHLVFDFEPKAINEFSAENVFFTLSQIWEHSDLETSLQICTEKVKELIGYDRVMVYKFMEEGHGVVIAESKNEGVEPYLNLHFPATDIPAQARKLYKINYTRIIADTNAPTPAVISLQQDGALLDLTHSQVRAVSPVHIEYLKNMFVAASFSISLIVDDELWGLIACHNQKPKYIDLNTREYAKSIGLMLSAKIKRSEASLLSNSLLEAAQILKEVELEKEPVNSFSETIMQLSKSFDTLIPNDGIGLLADNELKTDRICLKPAELMVLANHLQGKPSLYYDKSLDDAGIKNEEIAGYMALRLSSQNDYLFFFRKPAAQQVSWAGNPEKLMFEEGKIHPRNSFDKWTELVLNRSLPFTKNEVTLAGQLQVSILHIVNEWHIINNLQRARAYSYTISHDLNVPLAAIKNYAELLQIGEANLSAGNAEILERILNTSDKMAVLIKELLQFSRLEAGSMGMQLIAMPVMLEYIKVVMQASFKDRSPVIEIGAAEDIYGEESLIRSVFENLVSNAIKYTPAERVPVVRIRSEKEQDSILYEVSDEGSGIKKDELEQIFNSFSRGSNKTDVAGHGIGLATVKRILSMHNAKIWAESEEGRGTSFLVQFKQGGQQAEG